MDIQKIEQLGNQNVRVFQGDVLDIPSLSKGISEAIEWFRARGIETPSETLFDVITSDIAPSTTGMTGVDQYRSIELNIAILRVADIFLKT